MNLQELIGVKKYHTWTLNEIFAELHSRLGLEVIGMGRTGTVLSMKNSDFVYKVVEWDPAYLEFINFVNKNPNPHWPRMLKAPKQIHTFFTRLTGKPNKFWVFKIERLHDPDSFLVDFITLNLEYYTSITDTRYSSRKQMDIPRKVQLPDDRVVEITPNELLQEFPDFASLIGAYRQLLDANLGFTSDIHDGNFMQRKDGTIVFIDPLWTGDDTFGDGAHFRPGYQSQPKINQGPYYLKKPEPPVTAHDDIKY